MRDSEITSKVIPSVQTRNHPSAHPHDVSSCRFHPPAWWRLITRALVCYPHHFCAFCACVSMTSMAVSSAENTTPVWKEITLGFNIQAQIWSGSHQGVHLPPVAPLRLPVQEDCTSSSPGDRHPTTYPARYSPRHPESWHPAYRGETRAPYTTTSTLRRQATLL